MLQFLVNLLLVDKMPILEVLLRLCEAASDNLKGL
jgi:hypothetical protein